VRECVLRERKEVLKFMYNAGSKQHEHCAQAHCGSSMHADRTCSKIQIVKAPRMAVYTDIETVIETARAMA
jgi:hypothetical protein